jgi:hypothetical protein
VGFQLSAKGLSFDLRERATSEDLIPVASGKLAAGSS